MPTRSCGGMASPLVAGAGQTAGAACVREDRSPSVHQIANVEHEGRGGTGDPFSMRNAVEGMPELGMFRNKRPHIVETLAGGIERLLEFGLRLGLGLAKCHLHATVCVDLAFARRLDG